MNMKNTYHKIVLEEHRCEMITSPLKFLNAFFEHQIDGFLDEIDRVDSFYYDFLYGNVYQQCCRELCLMLKKAVDIEVEIG